MADEITVGSVDQTIDIFIQDSSKTDGSGLTGLVYNSASLTCYYRRGATGAWTVLSLVTQTITGAHANGGFVEGDATNAPGAYRLDLSDTMVNAAGVLKIMLKGAANMAPVIKAIEVVAVNKYDAVRGGMSALPNAAANAAGGLLISAGGALAMDTILGRITANVALASVCTEVRLAELGSTNLPADIDTLLTKIVGTLLAGNHTPQSANNDTKISTLLTRVIGTILAGNHTAQSANNDTKISTILAAQANQALEATLISGVNTLSAQNVSIYVDTQRLDALIENVGGDRYTTKALEQGPGGGTGLNAQQTRDALLLSPSGGGTATSIDGLLLLIKAVTDVFSFTGNDVKATLDGEVASANLVQVNGNATIDGSTFTYILELVQAMVNGRFKYDTPSAGKMTIYERDNTTPLTVMTITTTERTRDS